MTETVNRISFAISWTTTYPSILETGNGTLVTSAAHGAVFADPGPDRCLPWEAEDQHWSRFWTYYLGSPTRVWNISANAAWDRVVPFRWLHGRTLVAPPGVAAHAEVYLYPAAISVIVSADAAGPWSLRDVASEIESLRNAPTWGFSGSPANRKVDGIADDLRVSAESVLTAGTAQAGPPVLYTVAAPTEAVGQPASFDIEAAQDAAECLVGLSVLGPPGPLVPAHLDAPNSDPRRSGRIYALDGGHAVWNSRVFLKPPTNKPMDCFVVNQIDLVTHVAALSGMVSWADDRLSQGAPVPPAVQPAVRRAADRLLQLHDAPKGGRTYRSGIAKTRIEPILPAVQKMIATF